jgi:hypothetical protein
VLIIFGFRTFLRNLAIVTAVCPHCNNPAAHRIVKRTRMFTLFFIPLIPISIKTYSVCSFCGTTTKLDKESRDAALAAAAQAAPSTVPVEPSPQLPTATESAGDAAG